MSAERTQLIDRVSSYKSLKSSLEDKLPITLSELVALYIISENQVIKKSKAIIDTLKLSKAAVSILLGKLEKDGYISRITNPANRRNLIITLSTTGQEVITAADALLPPAQIQP